MSPTIPAYPAAGPRGSLQRLGGVSASALATLVLLSGCGVTSEPASADTEKTESGPVAAADAETSDQDETTSASTPSSAPAATTQPAETTSAAPTQEAAPEPEPAAPEPQSFSGSGAEVVILEPLGENVFFAEVTHQGSGNVALWSVDENGQDLDLMVNEIGSYAGQVALNFSDDPAAIRVEADGDWTINLVPLSEAPRWDGASAYEAIGDTIVIVSGVADGLTPVTLTHDGESNFAIWAWGADDRDLIVNEIGQYDGTTLLPDGSVVLQITADGAWTISKD